MKAKCRCSKTRTKKRNQREKKTAKNDKNSGKTQSSDQHFPNLVGYQNHLAFQNEIPEFYHRQEVGP